LKNVISPELLIIHVIADVKQRDLWSLLAEEKHHLFQSSQMPTPFHLVYFNYFYLPGFQVVAGIYGNLPALGEGGNDNVRTYESIVLAL
jgi:hypothetical protein